MERIDLNCILIERYKKNFFYAISTPINIDLWFASSIGVAIYSYHKRFDLELAWDYE